jgi:hypothetical protein
MPTAALGCRIFVAAERWRWCGSTVERQGHRVGAKTPFAPMDQGGLQAEPRFDTPQVETVTTVATAI